MKNTKHNPAGELFGTSVLALIVLAVWYFVVALFVPVNGHEGITLTYLLVNRAVLLGFGGLFLLGAVIAHYRVVVIQAVKEL
jgi:hypothetical protein